MDNVSKKDFGAASSRAKIFSQSLQKNYEIMKDVIL